MKALAAVPREHLQVSLPEDANIMSANMGGYLGWAI
jgi:hypothetical protein